MTFGLFSKNVAKVKTNCYKNVPIASSEDNYPVIIFNHGYSGHTMQSTILCSDLASSGYIVVSVGHPYEASGVNLKFFEKYLLTNQEIELKDIKYDGVEFRQK